MASTKPKNLNGLKFSKLKVLNKADNHKGRTAWICQCDCGVEVIVTTKNLCNNHTTSCGCAHREQLQKRNRIHGKTFGGKPRMYKIWVKMRSRCNNKNDKSYPRYGGRGITIDPYFNEFKNFESWAIQNGYKNTLSIERIDVNKGYSPKNCTWIPMSEQSRNTTKTVLSEDIVSIIKTYLLYTNYTYRKIAQLTGLKIHNIKNIRQGWANVSALPV